MIRSKILLSTAGGGKTTKLIERIKEVGDRVLILSFTRSACDEIFARSNIKAYTLHSFCMRLMNKNYLLMTHLDDIVRVLNHTSLSNDLVIDLLNRYDVGTKFNPPKELAEVYKYNCEFIELFNKIQEEKRKHNIYFFSDVLYEFWNSIDTFLPVIYDQYDHILVDEAQDLSVIQWQIIQKIITFCFNEHGKSFFIAGDRKQVIYDFNGSSQDLYDKNVHYLLNLNKNVNIEYSNRTYRFGGEIANLVSKEFEQHHSNIDNGNVYSVFVHKYDLVEYVKKLIHNLVNEYTKEQILVLYPRQNYLITQLQESVLNMGSKMKIYLKGHEMVDSLWNILNYCINGNDYYKVRVLQGPFIHINEPKAYHLISSPYFKNCYSFFFNKIKKLYVNAEDLFEFLSSSKIYCSQLHSLVFYEIVKLAHGSLMETLSKLPDFVYVEKPGIRFSSIHGSKGTESDVVIYVRDLIIPVSTTIKSDYFVLHDRIYTSMLSSLDYVAKTRAKQQLYIVNCENN